MIQQGRTQLLQTGECELHVGLDSDDPDAVEVSRQFCALVEQGRFADAGLSAEQQDTTAARTDVRQQGSKCIEFAGTSV
jgi:hypothetical protein